MTDYNLDAESGSLDTDGSDVNLKTVGIGAEFKDNSLVVSETDRLLFAKQILLFLFILVFFVFATSFILTSISPDNAKLASLIDTILDITKTSIPAIVALVLGFYFGKKES